MRASNVAAVLGLAGVLLPLAVACGSTPTSAPPPPAAARPAVAAATASASASAEAKSNEHTENDFVESDRNRNPFRTFALQTQAVTRQALDQRKVEIPEYSIDELKLVAIVLGGDQPRAMFVDPSSKGTVVYKGTFICKPEIVHIGGSNGPEYPLNWRVDRIREGDVVLIREDPAQPSIPAATRVVVLHPET